MKKKFKLFGALVASAILFLLSCKKQPELPQIPPDPVNYTLQITIDQLPGVTSSLNGLSALISLTKLNGETVFTDKPFALSYNGKYNTEAIPVQKGDYHLVKMIILKADGTVAFATPITGSVKASQVNKPLSLAIKTEVDATTLNVQVLPVSATDRSQDYGYLAGTFNERVVENPATNFSLTIQPAFTIGEIVYDSIPVSLKLTSHPLQGEPLTTMHSLPAGTNKIILAKQAAKYTLSLSKWGFTKTIDILPANMKDGLTYTFEGIREAKKLKFESVYRESGNQWLPETRKEYLYANNGKVNLINHYRKAADNSNVLDMKEEMTYENNRISQIKKSTNNQTSVYSYTGGKLTQIRHQDKDGETTGQLSYTPGTSKNYSVGAVFGSTKFYYKQNYSFDVINGVVLKSMYATTHGDTEMTLYQYDLGINPFIHLQLPELSYTHLSIHNAIKRYATYTTLIPPFDAYSFSYVYDAEGYPIELYTSYRVPGTATTAYTTKTVFNYY